MGDAADLADLLRSIGSFAHIGRQSRDETLAMVAR